MVFGAGSVDVLIERKSDTMLLEERLVMGQLKEWIRAIDFIGP